VEGFYGDPYEFEERLAMVAFLSEVGLNTYLYAPKDDPFHRERWDEPYPSEHLDHFESVQLLAEERAVRFIFGISPGGTYDPAAGGFEALMDKLESIYARGVRHFCVLFDDVSGDSPGADPLVQVDLLREVWQQLQSLDGETTLCFVPNFYFGTAEQLENDDPPPQLFTYPHPSSAYYEAYEAIPEEVSIMWTGRRVTPSTIETGEAIDFRRFVARPVVIWDNALANDLLLSRELFLGPYFGRAPELAEVVDGILINPMTQAEASKVMLFSAARAFAGDSYEPWQAWEDAIEHAAGGGAIAALQHFAEQFQSHPFIGDNAESAALGEAMQRFLDDGSSDAESALREQLLELSGNHALLTSSSSNSALRAEIEEPSRKLSLLADAALQVMDEWTLQQQGGEPDLESVRAAIERAEQIPWLVAADTPLSSPLLSDRPSKATDVFGGFFDEMVRRIGG
jgi:hyaluronoglucosaminidase